MDFLDSASISEARVTLYPGHSVMLILENLLIRFTGRGVKVYDGTMAELASAAVPASDALTCWVEEDTVVLQLRPIPTEEAPDSTEFDDVPTQGMQYCYLTYSIPTGRFQIE